MGSIKKYNDATWDDTKIRKLTTTTDTITTLPADIYADGDNATVGLKGNMSQTDTPTSQSPIQPSECGVRTGNLFDPNSTRYQMGKAPDNKISPYSGGAMFYIKAAPNTEYTIKIHATGSTFVRLYLSNTPIVEGTYISYNVVSESETTLNPEVTISNTDYAYLWIQVGGTWYTEHGGSSIMLNIGSTTIPHEPYGYKTPISSANITTPVYLGEVESTRQIKKLVLTGEETITEESANVYSIPITDTVTTGVGLSTHFVYDNSISDGEFRIEARKVVFGYNDTLANFSTFLAAQYAAGTPVTIWYVLATPETGIVNEPLRKIGDYADTVSGITIPTITGADSFDVQTTLKPSEVSLSYTGWHDAEVKEWNGSQWNE